MSVTMNVKGTSSDTFQVGKGGPKLKRNSNAIEARNTADSAYEVVRVADAVSDNDAVNKGQLTQAIRSAGVVTLPSYTNNGNGSITIGSGTYSLYDNANYQGTPKTYTIAGGTFVLTDNSANYVLASYNGGSPTIEIVTTVPPANTTDSDRVPIFSTYRSGNDIHFFNWDHLSQGLAEKLNQRLRRTDRFHIDNGLSLFETATRVINITSGEVWAGANLIALNSIDSSSPEVHFYYHVGGVWTRGNLSQYNNAQYDNGTNLVTLTNNKYAVNWVYRSVEQTGAIYVLLGTGDYSLLEAQASAEPVKPTEISTQAVLVGRIIVQKSASTATQIDRVVDVTFGASPIAAHNDLTGIQGGTTDQHYHLSNTQYQNLPATITVAGAALLDDADNTAQRTTLGLGTIATQNANNVAVTGGNIDGAIIGATTPAPVRSTVATTTEERFLDVAGDNHIRVVGQNVLTADYTLTLPAKTGTLATIDDITGGSTSTGVVFVNEFTNGVEFTAGTSTVLTLPTAETGNGHIIAFDGVIQFQSQYSIVGTTVTFSSAIPLGVNKVQVIRGLGAASTSAPTVTKTSSYLATASDYTIRCDATSGTLTVTLPAAATYVGKIYNLKKVDTSGNTVLVDPNGSELVDGQPTHTISLPYANLTIQSNGTGWDIL